MAIQTTKFGTLDTTRAPVTARQSDGTYALDFDIGGKKYTFVPSDVVNRGGYTIGETNYLLPYFTDKANIARFVGASDQVDLSASEPGIAKYLESQGRASTGYLLPADKVSFDSKVDTTPSTQMGSLVGLRMDDTGNIVYGVSGGHGKSYMTKDFQVHDPYTEVRHKIFGGKLGSMLVSANELISDLGPIGPALLNMWVPGMGTAVSAGLAIGKGASIGEIAKNMGLAYAGQEIGSEINAGLDKALADMGTAGDVIGNIAGQTAAGVISSGGKADLLSLLQSGALSETVSGLATEIPGYDQLSDAGKRAVNNAIAAELQGRDPTNALIGLARAAGESAMANATNVPTETEVQKQQDELQKQLAPYETPTPEPTPEPTPTTPDYPVQEMQITPENLASFQDTLSSNFQASQWQADDEGNYTLVGDDGSTITMHPDGTTSATEAPPENLLDAIGTTGGQPTQTTPTGGQPTQTTATGGGQPTQVTPAAAKAKGYTADQLQALGALIDQLGGQATPEEIQQATAGTAGAQTYAPSKEASFLDELGKTPEYYKAIDPETLQLLGQLGIDPAELLARQEAEGGAEDMGDHGEEGIDALEASGRLEGYKTPAGVKRGLPAGTFGLAGSDVAKAYQKAMQDRAIDYTSPYKQPIDEYYQNYLKKLGPATEATLNEAWGPYVAGRGTQLAGSGAPVRRDPTSDVIAYVPTSSIGASKYYDTAGLSPQLIAMVGEDPSLLNDPDRLALVMSHELAHAAPQRSVEGPNLSRVASAAQQAGQTPLGSIGGGKTQAELFKDLAGARDYLSQQYGYKGVYDQRTNMPLEELLADVGGWSMQSGVDITKDPYIQQNVLNTPEKMAVYNVMHPKRSVQFDPFYPPVGEVTAEDFLPYKPPKNWLFQQQLKKRMAGLFGQ